MIKMTRHIKSMTIRSGLITLLLLSVLLPTVRANVSATADSVYFHIKLDTLGILRTGQEVKLTYALVNSQFDSVAAPEFDSSIEVLRGPEPHKSSSYAIINGVESKTNETGFCYFVRFRESGEFQLPPASVKVGNQAYTTPECRVTVHPPEADLSKLQCHLRVAQLKKDFVKYCATLTCNARPDQNPPLLTINGETVRPTSNSYSGSDGKEEYVYKYYFSSNGYNVACKELTFGGIPYSVEPRVSKIDNDVFNLIVFGVVCALFELIWWLAYRYRYREEKDAALADFVLKRKTLPLIIDWAYTHYGASHMLMLVSMISLSVMGIMFYTNGQFVSAFLWFGGVLLLLAYVLYRSQRRKLDFSNIPTTLDKQSIYDKIYNLSVTYDWDVDHYGEDCIVAHTNPSLWHLTWGEQIFIVFDQGQVWVNSVNDLNKRTSICSFGHNKRNIRRIREALTQGAAIGSQEGLGTGLAFKLSSKFPEIQKLFKKYTRNTKFQAGDVFIGEIKGFSPGIIYIATQPDMYHAEFTYLNKGLKRLKKVCESRGIKTVSLPKIGAGLGKLDWNSEVKPLLESILSDCETVFNVYEDYKIKYEI